MSKSPPGSVFIPVLVLLAPALQAVPAPDDDEWTATVYGARISSERTWQHVLKDPLSDDYTNSYLITGALSRPYARLWNDSVQLEAEGQVTYHFGDQHLLELNAVPVVIQWNRFPWNRWLATSASFGLGLSYATERPPVEIALEGESHQWLVYWMLDLTAGPPDAQWAVTLRLHHRSVAFGLMGENGGMNAVGIGASYRFPRR
jgi:hypothetical protein